MKPKVSMIIGGELTNRTIFGGILNGTRVPSFIGTPTIPDCLGNIVERPHSNHKWILVVRTFPDSRLRTKKEGPVFGAERGNPMEETISQPSEEAVRTQTTQAIFRLMNPPTGNIVSPVAIAMLRLADMASAVGTCCITPGESTWHKFPMFLVSSRLLLDRKEIVQSTVG